jgi:predicted 2-oxoglutarate/Fe(II)-dependent dioxygenase YbiX
MPEHVRNAGRNHIQHLKNCTRLEEEKDYWSPRVLSEACNWVDRNHASGPFFLAVECFDPHEPFNCPPPYDTMYGPHIDGETRNIRDEQPETAAKMRAGLKAAFRELQVPEEQYQRLGL